MSQYHNSLNNLEKIYQNHNGSDISLKQLINLNHFAKILNIKIHKQYFNNLNGAHITNLYGRGMDYSESRIYQSGDDVRHIDWTVSARSNKLHTKIYHKEVENPVYVILDLLPSMYFGTKNAFKSVIASQMASLIAWNTIFKNDKFGGVIFSDQKKYIHKAQSNSKSILKFLTELSTFNENYITNTKPSFDNGINNNLYNILKNLKQILHSGSTVFIISDFYNLKHDQNLATLLYSLKKYNKIITIKVSDYIEKTKLPKGTYPICDKDNNFSNISINSKKDSEQIYNYFQDIKNNYTNLTNKLNIISSEVFNDENWIYNFMGLLK
tara:strand:- start:3251 stop:4225 length:975 start_codon:yes stop_codon:yes gene_type:complete